ncbi:hypothetical protein [Chitinophaga japonensis]|uniref:Uncharacterized protein n=1 Tax=Chitinophaga japonensis TaxID=104662 RepID=A0A562T0I0_CHIJA|nr:hypothetical protein [Chitinophaga japonensis]TWI87039.1 hypothetical protein LX66_4307 [Chitinophaga japonensis]
MPHKHHSRSSGQRSHRSVADNAGRNGVSAPAVAQLKLPDFTNSEKVAGFTNTNAYKTQLNEEQKRVYKSLAEDPQYNYQFGSRQDVISYLSTGTPAPVKTAIARVRGLGAPQPFTPEGYSGIDNFKPTEQHHLNWTEYVELHYGLALKRLNPASDKKTVIDHLYNEALKAATELDEATRLVSSSGLISANSTVAVYVKGMYDTAKLDENPAASGSPVPDIQVAKFLGQYMGVGIGVEASFTPYSSFPQGSGAGGESHANPPWYPLLKHRYTATNKYLYARGHLLNDHLGGPARPYNLVPLISNASGLGSTRVNEAHEALIEADAKEAVASMFQRRDKQLSPSPHDIFRVDYKVTARGFGQRRDKGFEQFHLAPLKIKKVTAELSQTGNADPTVAEFKAFVKAKSGGTDLWMNDFQSAFRSIDAEDHEKVSALLPLMQKNLEVWEQEDTIVPRELQYELRIHQGSSLQPNIKTIQDSIENKLPDDPRMKYQRNA